MAYFVSWTENCLRGYCAVYTSLSSFEPTDCNVTNCMEQSSSWQADSHSTSQEIPRLLLNPKVHYHVHKGQPLDPILSQMNLVHTISSRFIVILFSYLCLGLPNGLFPSDFPTKILYVFLISLMHATCAAHIILLDLITPITFGEVYKLWSPSLCSLLQPPVPSSLLGPNVLLRTLFPNALSLCPSISVKDQVLHPYETAGKLMFLYILMFCF
jgi:hypothetical protein